MAGNDPLIAFRSLPQVLVINASDIGTAYSRCFYLKQNLAVAWFWYRYAFEFNGTIPRKKRGLHGCLHISFISFAFMLMRYTTRLLHFESSLLALGERKPLHGPVFHFMEA